MLPAHPGSIRDGASRQINLILSSVPIHPVCKAGFSRHIPIKGACLIWAPFLFYATTPILLAALFCRYGRYGARK